MSKRITPAAPRALTAGPAPAPQEPPPDPAHVAADGPARGTADPGTPRLTEDSTRRLGPLLQPEPARLSTVLQWIAVGTQTAGEPVSVTVSAATGDAHIAVSTAEQFRQWCEHLRIAAAAVRLAHDVLGTLAESTLTTHGWALHVRLFGPAAEELQ